MGKRTSIDKLSWIIKLIITIIPVLWWVMGINRILRGRVIAGILWILTGAFLGIGWIIDIVTMIIKKDITVLA